MAMSQGLSLILRRGLADAAHKTNAWVTSCGDRSNEGAQMAGVANVYGTNLGYDSPFIAVVASGRMNEKLDDIQNGGVHRYGAKRAAQRDSPAASPAASPKLSPTGGGSSPTGGGLSPAGAKNGIELDSHHTHLVIVDGEQEAANGLRDRMEYFISSQDVSGDGVQTPKLLLVVGGDASTLDWVRNGLDATDSATLTAVPVLIIAGSGGAAGDIYQYCCPDSPGYKVPIEAGGTRSEEYVTACNDLLPEIEKLGKLTGNNSSKQMSFFDYDPDPDAENNLALAIQTALLNDCPNISQEAELAVAWGDSTLLQRYLEQDSYQVLKEQGGDDDSDDPPLSPAEGTSRGTSPDGISSRKGGLSPRGVKKRPCDDLLQIALQQQDVEVVRTLLEYTAEPSHVIMDELFQERFNHYAINETSGMWVREVEIRQRKAAEAAHPKAVNAKTATIKSNLSRSPSKGRISMMKQQRADGSGSPLKPAKRETKGEIKIAMKETKKETKMQLWHGWGHAQQVLGKMVNGYSVHLDVRRELAHDGGSDGRITPMFTDLMMWAVLAGQHELAVVLWSKAEAPLRAALMASQLCQWLASNPLLRADKDELSECSINYEDLGVELLNSVRESDDAMDLITLMPWEWGSGRRHLNKRKQAKEDAANSSHFGRELLWDYSVLDIAALGDGRLSRPCMRFVAHRHCRTPSTSSSVATTLAPRPAYRPRRRYSCALPRR